MATLKPTLALLLLLACTCDGSNFCQQYESDVSIQKCNEQSALTPEDIANGSNVITMRVITSTDVWNHLHDEYFSVMMDDLLRYVSCTHFIYTVTLHRGTYACSR